MYSIEVACSRGEACTELVYAGPETDVVVGGAAKAEWPPGVGSRWLGLAAEPPSIAEIDIPPPALPALLEFKGGNSLLEGKAFGGPIFIGGALGAGGAPK